MQDTLSLSKALLGKLFVHEYNGVRLICRITETEGYIGSIDKASHAYRYKRTERTKIMFRTGGFLYVYLIYGMYCCMNVVCEKEGEPCAVLIRGVEPVSPLDALSSYRYGKNHIDLTSGEKKNFANGPGKACKALKISKDNNGQDLCGDMTSYERLTDSSISACYICEDETTPFFRIGAGKRVNIDYAEEAKDFMWRFFIQS